MKLLLDTHVLIWYCRGEQLPKKVITEIENIKNQIFVSKVSLWEIVIKASLGKLNISLSVTELEKYILQSGFIIVDFNIIHLEKLYSLPFLHRDPFDRLLIAQSLVEGYKITTKDSFFKNYQVNILW